MRLEQHRGTISAEEAYKRGYYYILLIRNELDGPYFPVTNFLVGDAVAKFAEPEDAEEHAQTAEEQYAKTYYGYRIAKVTVEEVKTVENAELNETTNLLHRLFAQAIQKETK